MINVVAKCPIKIQRAVQTGAVLDLGKKQWAQVQHVRLLSVFVGAVIENWGCGVVLAEWLKSWIADCALCRMVASIFQGVRLSIRSGTV
ncbi:hypothetical protein [Xanthomonas vesicatoria]|uniref:hypothetical protein n=1 Tax=Xanthomonas vesicatoria TaxID=56460 RepID=UPI001E3FD010|nr:hypothetical protein [Xanthomonas vesicatoria]MCC8626473.1 hypothetical protein [Xanthomonas vesicatoria]